MCLDKRAYRSLAAWKGWQTRRQREAGLEGVHRPNPSEGWATIKDKTAIGVGGDLSVIAPEGRPSTGRVADRLADELRPPIRS